MGKRETKHAHASCLHEELEYCRHCNIVYCDGCDITWRQYTYPQAYPWNWSLINSGAPSLVNQTSNLVTTYGDQPLHSTMHGQLNG